MFLSESGFLRSQTAAPRDEVRVQHDCSVHVAGALVDLLEEQFDGQLELVAVNGIRSVGQVVGEAGQHVDDHG